jgi:hypothetical protein
MAKTTPETEADYRALDREGWRRLLQTIMPTTVPAWPAVGVAMNISRAACYRLANDGTIPVLHLGRSLRVPSRWLAERLMLDTESNSSTIQETPTGACCGACAGSPDATCAHENEMQS